jgi:hypothetical protein
MRGEKLAQVSRHCCSVVWPSMDWVFSVVRSPSDTVRFWIEPRSGGSMLAVGLSPRKRYSGSLRRVASLEMVREIQWTLDRWSPNLDSRDKVSSGAPRHGTHATHSSVGCAPRLTSCRRYAAGCSGGNLPITAEPGISRPCRRETTEQHRRRACVDPLGCGILWK